MKTEIVKKIEELPRIERKRILKKYGRSTYRALLKGKLLYAKKIKKQKES